MRVSFGFTRCTPVRSDVIAKSRTRRRLTWFSKRTKFQQFEHHLFDVRVHCIRIAYNFINVHKDRATASTVPFLISVFVAAIQLQGQGWIPQRNNSTVGDDQFTKLYGLGGQTMGTQHRCKFGCNEMHVQFRPSFPFQTYSKFKYIMVDKCRVLKMY